MKDMRFPSISGIGHAFRGAVWTVLFLVFLGVVGLLAYGAFFASRTIDDLLGENRELQATIANLTREEAVGYAKVLEQREEGGRVYTKILFVMTDGEDQTERVLERTFEVEGDVVFFDALIIKYQREGVAEGREKALFLWRRAYSDKMAPEDGIPIEAPDVGPSRYEEISAKLSLRRRALFWEEIWRLSDEPQRLSEHGIRAVYGSAVYRKMRPGLIYRFKIDASGSFFPESYPDL